MKPLTECPSLEVLIDLSYGELEPSEAGPVQLHIEGCEGCTGEWTALLQAQQFASELPGGPVTPSPAVEARLVQMVEGRQSLWRRLRRAIWDTVSSPVPAYQALLGGAAIGLMVQIFISTSSVEVVPPNPPPRAPDPAASAIRIQPVEDLSLPVPRQGLEQTVDGIPADQYADVF